MTVMATPPVELSQELRDQIHQQVERLRQVVDRIEELLADENENETGGNA